MKLINNNLIIIHRNSEFILFSPCIASTLSATTSVATPLCKRGTFPYPRRQGIFTEINSQRPVYSKLAWNYRYSMICGIELAPIGGINIAIASVWFLLKMKRTRVKTVISLRSVWYLTVVYMKVTAVREVTCGYAERCQRFGGFC